MIICLIMEVDIFELLKLNFLGLNFALHEQSLLILYGEGFAYSFLTLGLLLLVGGIKSWKVGITCFSLFSIAISIRPNLLVFVGILSAVYFFLPVFSNQNKKNKFIDLLGLSPLLLIPVHNLYFGHKFVLLTTASTIAENMPLTPKMYWDGLLALCGMLPKFEWGQKFINQFYFQNGFTILFLMSTNMVIAFKYRLSNKIGSLAIACLCGLCLHLFYLAIPRYIQPYTLISCFLIFTCLVQYCSSLRSR